MAVSLNLLIWEGGVSADLGCAADGACPGTPDNWLLPAETPVREVKGWIWDGILGGDLWS